MGSGIAWLEAELTLWVAIVEEVCNGSLEVSLETLQAVFGLQTWKSSEYLATLYLDLG